MMIWKKTSGMADYGFNAYYPYIQVILPQDQKRFGINKPIS
jgi:hypothetical protein